MTQTSTPAGFTRAEPEDAEALLELARRSYEIYVPVIKAIPLPMSADYGAMVRDHEVWIIRSQGAIAASLVLIHEPDHLMIESIAVDPDHQGSGYGRELLDWAGRRAEALNLPEMRLYTNFLMTRNRAWYKRAGFTETHIEQRGDKRVVHMRRPL